MKDEKSNPVAEALPIPTIDAQIRFIRKDRNALENALTIDGRSEENIRAYQEEIQMLRAIEENLIAVKLWNKSTATDHQKTEEGVLKKWPTTGDSVAVRCGSGNTKEWVDAYVVTPLPNGGVAVRTYWGSNIDVTDLSQIRKGSAEVKTEVHNG